MPTRHLGKALAMSLAFCAPALAADGPAETGQDAFAATAEIVQLLAADPDTDWDRVDIGALVAHLRDMDRLFMNAEVEHRLIGGGLSMRVSTTGPGGAAARAMVPAHAPMLAAETGWTSTVEDKGDALVWTVTDTSAADGETRIRALGFFGLMATGAHHRSHHLALARGARGHAHDP